MSTVSPTYDRIGSGYTAGRRTDPTWAAAILEALGDADTIVNVGAGTGSYEPAGRRVIAVEPSSVMLSQRPPGAAPAVRGVAERLPLGTRSADAALAVLTVHHWHDWRTGLDELCRVAPLRLVLTFDPVRHADQWIVRQYVPEIAHLDAMQVPYDQMVERLDAEVRVLPMGRDFSDGCMGAFWCRPHAYLDPEVRRHMSGFALVDPAAVDRGMARLADDLASGAWAERNGDLADAEHSDAEHSDADTYDAGCRLLVSGAPG